MPMRIDRRGPSTVAVYGPDAPVVATVQDGLDLLPALWDEPGCHSLAIHSACLAPEFFRLSTRLAGELLQKYTNYHIRVAIVGDFSQVESTSLRDFIRECNRGGQVRFVPDEAEALDILHGSKS